MTHWSDIALGRLDTDGRAALVTVIAAHGSAPRGPGARMVVGPDSLEGTIGGGNLEYVATARARDMLSGDAVAEAVDYSLGPKLDQCCGGQVSLLFEPLAADDRDWLEAVSAKAASRTPHLRRVTLGGGAHGAEILAPGDEGGLLQPGAALALLDAAGQAHTARRVPAADIGAVIEPIVPPRPRLFMFGAGHVGRAVARILGALAFEVTWVDPRADAFPTEAPDNIDMRVSERPADQVAAAPPGAFYLVFTHSHPLDFEITAAILARGDARYCGLIGSETKRVRFIKRFREECGLDEDRIGGLTCPIGLDGPPGKEPEVIAIGVAAELLREARA